MSAPATPDRAAWDKALSDYEGAKAVCDAIAAIEKAGHDQGDAWDKAADIAWPLLEALLATPAPDAIAMGMKARHVIDQAHTTEPGDSPDNPDTIARLLSGDWSERALAALYMDGLRLAGSDSPALTAKAIPRATVGQWGQA